MEDLGVQWDFLVCLEMRGSGWHEDVDAGLLLLQARLCTLSRLYGEGVDGLPGWGLTILVLTGWAWFGLYTCGLAESGEAGLPGEGLLGKSRPVLRFPAPWVLCLGSPVGVV